ncbi:PREDICTED: uncharacterized protein LOC105459727 [Wasmannia auropunctata]|uniref:uncharacterized protein LOC105459727 n=1 Tax=Wasmannia auropunctata TaxID=64793 RepID=UPI0005EDCA51|nr:PREDICTED: uncharacterized protein LOC105459727 [Wasmannia auropunctata]
MPEKVDRVDVTAITKFNGENYPQWKFQIVCALRAKSILDIVKGEKKKPNTNTDGEADAWDRKDALAMFTITSAMEFKQIALIENCNTSHEAQHISKVESLARQIKDSGDTVSNLAIMTKIISTLPMKYKGFRQAWMSTPEDQQTLSNLTARLLDEEASLTVQEEQDNALAEKFVLQRKTDSSGYGNQEIPR